MQQEATPAHLCQSLMETAIINEYANIHGAAGSSALKINPTELDQFIYYDKRFVLQVKAYKHLWSTFTFITVSKDAKLRSFLVRQNPAWLNGGDAWTTTPYCQREAIIKVTYTHK